MCKAKLNLFFEKDVENSSGMCSNDYKYLSERRFYYSFHFKENHSTTDIISFFALWLWALFFVSNEWSLNFGLKSFIFKRERWSNFNSRFFLGITLTDTVIHFFYVQKQQEHQAAEGYTTFKEIVHFVPNKTSRASCKRCNFGQFYRPFAVNLGKCSEIRIFRIRRWFQLVYFENCQHTRYALPVLWYQHKT